MAELIHIEKVPANERTAFSKKVASVATALQTNPDWLMQVMKAESGISPSIRNTYAPFYKNGKIDGYATGLIQFIPDTARGLKTTTWALEKMNRITQMDYVYKYLAPYKGKLNSYFDMYLVVFFPAAVGKSGQDNYVFEAKKISRSAIARSNPAININKDAMITMAEFKQYLKNTVPEPLWDRVFENKGKISGGFFLLER